MRTLRFHFKRRLRRQARRAAPVVLWSPFTPPGRARWQRLPAEIRWGENRPRQKRGENGPVDRFQVRAPAQTCAGRKWRDKAPETDVGVPSRGRARPFGGGKPPCAWRRRAMNAHSERACWHLLPSSTKATNSARSMPCFRGPPPCRWHRGAACTGLPLASPWGQQALMRAEPRR